MPLDTHVVLAQGFVEQLWLPADYWDLSIPVYLFLAVVAGGGFLAGATAQLVRWRRDTQPGAIESDIARWGFLVAVLGAAGAGLAVLSHLAVIYRALLFPIYLTNFSSWITIGTWILVVLSVIAIVCLLLSLFGTEAAADDGASLFPRAIVAKLGLLELLDGLVDRVRPPRVVIVGLYVIGSLLAVATIYTGFELAIVETVPLWNMPVVVPLAFLFSGLAAGVGLTVALTVFFEREVDPVVGGYTLATGVLSGLSLVTVWYGWTEIATSDAPAAAASQVALTETNLAVGAWLVVVALAVALVVGLVVGVAALTGRGSADLERVAVPALVGSFGLLVLGGLALRIVMLLAAQQDPVVVLG
ncbi:polysulfide reductase NrfD family protein [Natrarchaeobaculum sulfurireducens]|uniref:Formate-dependent nitrite reductase, membrane component n=1 Tax=Natrarchaeobaculum sulfurireducens TaxID=2044521 RepID=A0A346PCZ0_9EURY|nr:dehydrogenase [Natrarchaeobaculum sulfurireducens]AXR77385.1 Formate-dependent nitrite reductase, membrane component [Natrarchaeobaculum sulfurireducens]